MVATASLPTYPSGSRGITKSYFLQGQALNESGCRGLTSKKNQVKRFWILDLRFWIDPVHKGTGLGDFRLSILDLFRPQGAGGGINPDKNGQTFSKRTGLLRLFSVLLQKTDRE
jgi:hypothetical protein